MNNKDVIIIDTNKNSNNNKSQSESKIKPIPLKKTYNLEYVKPAILPAPYPPLQVEAKNRYYAELLSNDYCGAVSELTAITEYINHEIRVSKQYCEISKTLLSIAQAEMIHLQKLGEVIILLGNPLKYNCYNSNTATTWTPNFIAYRSNIIEMIVADIEGEKAVISQYKKHAEKIDDSNIKRLLKRIILDEEYHIELLCEILEVLKSDNDKC